MTIHELMTLFKDDEYLSTSVIEKRLNVSRFQAYKFLKELISKNIIHRNERG